MKVNITNKAYNDIEEFIDISKANDKNLQNYVTSLLKFALELRSNPKMGKHSFNIKIKANKYEIRQLIYKQHKILYYIDNSIHIVGFMHTRANTNDYIRNLRKYI